MLGILFDEHNMTELLLILDTNTDQLRPAKWRLKMARENPSIAHLLV